MTTSDRIQLQAKVEQIFYESAQETYLQQFLSNITIDEILQQPNK